MNKKILLLHFTILLSLSFPFMVSAQYSDKKSIVAPDAQLQKLGGGFTFTEGPAADAKGNVYFTDQPNNKIIRWSAGTGEITTFLTESGRSNGMYFDSKGNLITCADMENQLWSIDPLGNHTVLVENYNGKLLNGPNDLWIAPDGGIYFTDPLYKRDYWKRNPEMQQDGQHVYYLSPDRKKVIRAAQGFIRPNGIVGTPNGKKLYIADIGANKTYVYDIEKDGTLSNKTLFVEMGSDGMTIDNKGNIYLTGKGVTVFNKKGKQIAHITVDENWTANVCFGGNEGNMLFITASTAVYGLRMNVKGVNRAKEAY